MWERGLPVTAYLFKKQTDQLLIISWQAHIKNSNRVIMTSGPENTTSKSAYAL